ncbi:two-component system, OmpR family, phosphate regulon sensor histidine kinase PhoR [Tenacibaculum sp. MAR_2010_89]|uniref:sensor histidine kinase n=1 Tax=Tenacibaculum sp. MAR_2010_89 TaxID=1250198 RepID=UPI0008992824|nr:HAMP domain-containing sensor histidine kinase [Tenacibaculum sp. MAR_2010_89]SEE24880.1 two-component system, OmpR family, phosphate regulon sensor histidine kinase PhoR [Tenacibaculum sp. MAR_2010_89]
MNEKKHRWIFYLISATILATIAVQFYWNYKNYEQNKQYVINEIQESLDSSIEEYFLKLSKENFFAIIQPKKTTKQDSLAKQNILNDIFSPLKKTKVKDSVSFKISSLEFTTDSSKEFEAMDSIFIDSIMCDINSDINKSKKKPTPIVGLTQFSKDKKTGIHINSNNKISKVKVFTGKRATDSLKLIKGLQTMFISIKNDTINHTKIDSILRKDLQNKGILTSYYFQHKKKDSIIFSNKMAPYETFPLVSEAKSTFLKLDEEIALHYGNPTIEALKRSSTGILLSFILSLAVISSLFYLLRIINKQKELAEIKNDLISNITHEFKTPITTVSAAIEAIDNFNMIDDKEKTKKYLSISSIQLKKLHQMVEKLLETATLDSEKLLLKKEEVNIIDLIEKTSKKHQLINNSKTITFSSSIENHYTEVDTFHFENAVSNLIDNAVKYGGDIIEINVNKVLNTLEISVADNGKGIEKNQQERIFDKFYRVPKGNTHDVKGFGIGLYYTKKIIEKHEGSIFLISNSKHTIFKINLPNG